jgi:hypothetical protein
MVERKKKRYLENHKLTHTALSNTKMWFLACRLSVSLTNSRRDGWMDDIVTCMGVCETIDDVWIGD